MTTDTIPQDIREKANAAASAAIRRAASWNIVEPLREEIALALLAHEREVIERCAKIARSFAATSALISSAMDDPVSEAARMADAIATSIRETAR